MMLSSAILLTALAQLGPGSGPWTVSDPARHGLSAQALKEAADAVENQFVGRACYLVVKNGEIVYEQYYGGRTEDSIQQGFSTTKSHCGALWSLAEQQGWANRSQLVRDRNQNTRRCNPDATFENVLTMTGQSENLNNPTFSYDAGGNLCLDTLTDFIQQNNPEGLSAQAWKDKYWAEPLGLEHSRWTGANLPCGSGSVFSCRDLARAGQLFANDGAWPGAGQIGSAAFFQRGRTHVFDNTLLPYGYTTWLQPNDVVDPEVASMIGMLDQCAIVSKKLNAVVISMGTGVTPGYPTCNLAWRSTRHALVSNASISKPAL